ncbi:sialate O-acetylesterase [Clostridium sp. E02]|uniref:sialate O-acetylesterase n=1 Tax=Clostridium sp. E02 TaxID=2487134 RepID=UPI000F526011|nr:sialate O-acetylesterase [Clostridium sp. E02]
MARIELPEIFQDGMMFQREKPIKIWGKTNDGEQVTVCFCGEKISTRGKDLEFYLELPSQKASIHNVLTIYLEEEKEPEIIIKDISIGDIFIAAGQSNMEYFLRYDSHFNEIKQWDRNENIHMFNVKRIAYNGQVRDLEDSGTWFMEHDFQWDTFSAPGYAFARCLQPVLSVPVGVIGCNWGGTPACAWMAPSYLEQEPLNVFEKEYQESVSALDPVELKNKSLEAWAFEDSYEHQIATRALMYGMSERDQERWMEKTSGDPALPLGPYHHYRPSGLYEHMLKTIAPFPVKGVLWYQGESDSGHGDIYHKTFSALIQCWRDLWKDELPFLFVQLAPFGKWLNIFGTDYPAVRESQEVVSKKVPMTGMVSIMDLGMYEDIHPKQKIEVGERLALLARGMIYGEDILCESPEFSKVEREKDHITLYFTHAGNRMYLKGNEIKSLTFVQNGEPKRIKTFEVDTKVSIWLDGITKEPITIRYAKEGYCEVNLFNEAGLPAKPFEVVCPEE